MQRLFCSFCECLILKSRLLTTHIYLISSSRRDRFTVSLSQNRVLEMALHSSGLQSKSKKLYREEMSRLVDQEQQLLRQENERLHADVLNAKADLAHCREKVSLVPCHAVTGAQFAVQW